MQTRAKISLWEERVSSDIYESSPISWCWLLERGDFMTHGPFSRLYWVSNWDRFSQDLVCTQNFFGGEFDVHNHEIPTFQFDSWYFHLTKFWKNILNWCIKKTNGQLYHSVLLLPNPYPCPSRQHFAVLVLVQLLQLQLQFAKLHSFTVSKLRTCLVLVLVHFEKPHIFTNLTHQVLLGIGLFEWADICQFLHFRVWLKSFINKSLRVQLASARDLARKSGDRLIIIPSDWLLIYL